VPAVLNLTTSGQGDASASAARRGSSTSLEHADDLVFVASPQQNSADQQLHPTRSEHSSQTPSGVVQTAEDCRDTKMTLNDLEGVAPAGSASNEAGTQDTTVTSVALGDEQAGRDATADTTLNDLEQEKALPVDLPVGDVTVSPASDQRDVCNGIVKVEERMETTDEHLWKDKQPSPASEGRLLYTLFIVQKHRD